MRGDFNMNNIEIMHKLLVLFNKKKAGLTHNDYFRVGIFTISDSIKNSLVIYKRWIMETDTIPILIEPAFLSYSNDLNECFAEYDYHVLIKHEKNIQSITTLSILPINQFITNVPFEISTSLKAAVIIYNYELLTTDKYFSVPQDIILDTQYLYPLNKSLTILKKIIST